MIQIEKKFKPEKPRYGKKCRRVVYLISSVKSSVALCMCIAREWLSMRESNGQLKNPAYIMEVLSAVGNKVENYLEPKRVELSCTMQWKNGNCYLNCLDFAVIIQVVLLTKFPNWEARRS